MTGAIEQVLAREVIDRKGHPTIEVDVVLDDGSMGRAAAPGGTSRGLREPVDLRDNDPQYFDGKGVNLAIRNVRDEIGPCLRGTKAIDQEEIDGLMIELDGTDNRSRLGSNAIVATSLANAKAAAASTGKQLFEILGGGSDIPLAFVYVMFSGPAYVGVGGICDFQEFALLPLFAKSYKEGYVAAMGIQQRLREIVAERQGSRAPNIKVMSGPLIARLESNEEALEILSNLIEKEGYIPGEDFGIYLDIAASQLFQDGRYHLNSEGKVLSTDGMIDWLADLCDKYPIISMEDCLFEEDWEAWKKLTDQIGGRVQIVGDDLFVTDAEMLSKGIELGAANAIIIKLNQAGTVTETIETIRVAQAAGYGTIVSPRSGEIWDPYIAHLCVGQNLGQGKISGAYTGGEANLNELNRIQEYLGDRARYAGRSAVSRFTSD